MKKNDFNKLAEQAKNKIKNAKDMAQDKMQDLELDKKLDSLKEQTQKTMSATAEKVKEMELDKKLSNLNDNVEKYAKATAEKTKETVSSAAKKVKDMELDKKIENSEFEKRTGIFAKIKRYRAVIAVAVLVIVVISGFTIIKNGGNDNVAKTNSSTNRTSTETSGNTENATNSGVQNSKTAIVGKWVKETGVYYTFEDGGHMSVSLSKNYDKSKGSSVDGMEVTRLLEQIEKSGRVISGGTWEYKGESGGVSTYNLYYNGSNHTCSLRNDGTLMIALTSGVGEPNILTKVE